MAVAAADDDAAEQLIWHLQGRGYVVRTLLEQQRTGRIATVRLDRDTERAVYVDLLFASSGIESEIVRDAEELEVLDDLRIRVASRAHLIAMKVLARDDRKRPQDWDDLRALLTDASEKDVQTTQEALDLIALRGFNRDRDLRSDLVRAIADVGR
jgi:hypothetical protein